MKVTWLLKRLQFMFEKNYKSFILQNITLIIYINMVNYCSLHNVISIIYDGKRDSKYVYDSYK